VVTAQNGIIISEQVAGGAVDVESVSSEVPHGDGTVIGFARADDKPMPDTVVSDENGTIITQEVKVDVPVPRAIFPAPLENGLIASEQVNWFLVSFCLFLTPMVQ
jgi:hypothetical protein